MPDGPHRALSRGGDRRSGRIYPRARPVRWPRFSHSPKDLLKERDLSVGTGTVWRFFDRHGISFKKNRARRREAP